MHIRRKKTILEQAADYVEAAVEKAGPILADAKELALDKAETVLAEVRDQAGPRLAEAKDKAAAKAGPALADARERATPLIVQGAAIAAEKASQAADVAAEKAAHGKELTAAKAAELARPRKQKKHRLRRLLILTGLAAVVGFAVKKLQSGGDKQNWQSTYTPTPPPAPRSETPIADAAAAAQAAGATSATEGATEPADEGGAGPDEALADAEDESHRVTTPDEPADVVEVPPGEEPVTKDPAQP
jgi:hypothetical protein